MEVNFYDVERAFIGALIKAGIAPSDTVSFRFDGHKHRFKVAGDKGREKSGEYCIYMDQDNPAGYFKSYKATHACPYCTWCFKSEAFKGLSDEDRKAYIEEMEKKRKKKEEEKLKEEGKAVHIARDKYKYSTDANPLHSYILNKGLHEVHNARLFGSDLIIPYINTKGEIMTVQTISEEGEKRFQSGAPKQGNFSVMWNYNAEGKKLLTKRTWVTEGWATGASIKEATGETVIVAADCGNLAPVVRNLLEAWGSIQFVVAGDNDRHHGNPGSNHAVKIMEELAVPYVIPDFTAKEKGSDWNDYAALHGLEETKTALEKKLQELMSTPRWQAIKTHPHYIDYNERTGGSQGTLTDFKILLRFLGIEVSYNEIKKEIIIDIPGTDYCSDEAKNAALGTIISCCTKWKFPTQNIDVYLSVLASENVVNPVKDWILSKKWDGKSRLQEAFDSLVIESYYDREFKELLMKRWFISAVAAAFHPGFHARGVLTLIGDQSIGKTTWFKTMAGGGDFFAEGVGIDPNDKDSVKRAISFWIVEFGELEGTFKRSDQSSLKNFITKSIDTIRLPWGRRTSDFQRRTIFGATVNQVEILLDDTGNSRWWCLPVKYINPIQFDIQQFWAEIYEEHYLKGEQWWLEGDEEVQLNKNNWTFQFPNPVEDLIVNGLEWSADKEEWTRRTATEVLMECKFVGIPKPGDAVRAAKILRQMTGDTAIREGHERKRVWLVPPAKASEDKESKPYWD